MITFAVCDCLRPPRVKEQNTCNDGYDPGVADPEQSVPTPSWAYGTLPFGTLEHAVFEGTLSKYARSTLSSAGNEENLNHVTASTRLWTRKQMTQATS